MLPEFNTENSMAGCNKKKKSTKLSVNLKNFVLTFYFVSTLGISALSFVDKAKWQNIAGSKKITFLNPHWHELKKQEKCLPILMFISRGIFYQTQELDQGVLGFAGCPKITPHAIVFEIVFEIFAILFLKLAKPRLFFTV